MIPTHTGYGAFRGIRRRWSVEIAGSLNAPTYRRHFRGPVGIAIVALKAAGCFQKWPFRIGDEQDRDSIEFKTNEVWRQGGWKGDARYLTCA